MPGLMFDDIPDTQAPQAPKGPVMFDDIPDHAPAPAAQAPTQAPAAPAPVMFDDIAHQEPNAPAPSSSPASPQVVAQGLAAPSVSPKAYKFIKDNPARPFSLAASPAGAAQLAKAGTVGTSEEYSDANREATSMKDSAVGFFNSRIQQLMLEMQAAQLSPADQDAVIDAQVTQWEQAGLPAGQHNAANPSAWLGVDGKNSLREAMNHYVNDIRTNGIANASEVKSIFDPQGKLVTAQAPTLFGYEAPAAAALEFTRGMPGMFGGNVGGELGALAGEASGLPGGGIIGGIGGSIAGAFGGEAAMRGALDEYGGEDLRNSMEALDNAANMANEEHPIAGWVGRMGGQFAHNQLGFQQLLRGEGLSAALAPRLSGALIGGGVEAGSEAGRGDSFDPYKIGEAALSGSVFTKPRYLGEGSIPMSFEGRNWTDTNVAKPELYGKVDELLRSGSAPADVMGALSKNLPDTPENRRALRVVAADIRHGRDPAQSLDNLQFRPGGLSVDKTLEAVNNHVKDWTDAPGINVHDSYDSDSIPVEMKDKVGPGTLGWKDENGQIHIVASQHADAAAVNATMFHEGMHVGLVRAYQNGLNDKLVQLYDGANPGLRRALDKMEAEQSANNPDWSKLSEDEKKSLVTDEVLASTSENGIHKESFDKIAAWVRGFGRTRMGEMGKRLSYSDAEVRQILSTGHDAVSKGSGEALSPTRYMNFGVGSQTADLDSLDSYRETGGVPRKPEYERGWFEGPADEAPRYEVSDNKAQFGKDLNLSTTKGVNLDKVLEHPALYEAYPHLKEIKVKLDNDPEVSGSWSKRANTIYLNPKAHMPLETILHEVQHAIQDHEGWSRGANVDSVYRTAPKDAIDALVDPTGIGRAAGEDIPEWDWRAEVRHNPTMAETLYNRAGGEYEARATAARREMDDLDRLDHPQFQKADRTGTHPADLYNPMEVGAPSSERAMPKYTEDDLAFFSAVDKQAQDARDRKLVEQNLRQRDRDRISDTRFSRKYSDNFGTDYTGRQERTEDMITSHFGPVFNNIRGMMRPLEEYSRVSNEQVIEAANELKDQGLDAGLAIAQGAIPDNSGYVVALKDLVREKLTNASEIAGRYRHSGGMRHERELMRSVTELGQVMSVFDKTASNLGRMLHSLNLKINEAPDAGLQRMLDSIRFANGKLDPVEMDKIAQALMSQNPVEIRKAIDKFDPKWKQYGQSLFYNFILGSKAVQLGNIMGNASHIAQKGLGDILGYGVGLGKEGVFHAGNKLGLDVTKSERMHSDELLARTSGLIAGLLNKETYNSHRAFNTAAKEFFTPAGQSEHVNKFASQSIENLPMSLVLEYGTRGLQAGDAFFRTVIEHGAMQGLATREARKLNGGKTPTTEQIADVMASPSRELLSKVTDEADRITFQEKPFGGAERFSRLMRGTPGGWILAPIIRTPSNIGRAAFETFDPTGRISQRNRQALKAGGVEANRVHGQQLLATALWAGALYLMNNEMLTGGGPTNPAARAQWLLTHKPYTIGNAETGTMPLRGISPVGDGLSTIADMRDAVKFGTKGETAAEDKALMVAAGLTGAYLNNSYLDSVTGALDRGIKPTMQNLMGTLVQSAVSVPLLSQVKKEQDPFVRDTSNEGSIFPSLAGKASLMDNDMATHYFKSIKPRDELPIRRDPFGAPIMADSPTSKDPVAQEIGRLVATTGKSVVPAFARTSKGEHVPNDIYNNFLAFSGPIMRTAVEQIMKDPKYLTALTNEQRAAIIHSNKSLKGLHTRLNKQLEQMMLDRKPTFEGNYISDDMKTLMTLPGE